MNTIIVFIIIYNICFDMGGLYINWFLMVLITMFFLFCDPGLF